MDQRVGEAVRASLAEGDSEWIAKVFILSGPSDGETLMLDAPIKHEPPNAWTQYQRYVTSAALAIARTTADLDG